MFPSTLAFTYLGFVGREALQGEQEGLIRNGLIALALLTTVAFVPRMVKRWGEAADEDDGEGVGSREDRSDVPDHGRDVVH
jgi:hypothetical protein